jgi:hypothetical protein
MMMKTTQTVWGAGGGGGVGKGSHMYSVYD